MKDQLKQLIDKYQHELDSFSNIKADNATDVFGMRQEGRCNVWAGVIADLTELHDQMPDNSNQVVICPQCKEIAYDGNVTCCVHCGE